MSRLLVMAGGTGGHVYPALAVAERLRAEGVEVVWIGTQAGLEARAVPAAGFEIEWVNVKGLRGKGLARWFVLPIVLSRAMLQTWSVIGRRQPDALLGMGGFVAGPGGVVGWLRRRPLVIHEQNAVCGMTNWLLTPLSRRVLTGFPKAGLPGRKARWVGNPVREAITAIGKKRGSDNNNESRTINSLINVLVVGGSQGARALNTQLPAALNAIIAQRALTAKPNVWHQCGRGNASTVQALYNDINVDAKVSEFIDDMAHAYMWADLIVCRAGAMTVSEVATCGLAALFVPYPHAVGDHQAANAAALVDAGAALMVREGETFSQQLTDSLADLLTQPEQLGQMGIKARELAKPDASEVVARACLEVMHA